MQLLALALYSFNGSRRDVRFEPGKLNIVTGESKTGKSALLTITEFCLGRSKNLIPAGGPISQTVAWYGSLWQLGADTSGPRAFVGRPAPTRGSSQRAMLEFGDATLDLLDFADLRQNSDTESVRRQLGRRIGIAENVIESRQPGMSQTPFEAHLGHAVWLCLQDQDEIANRTMLFHRQGERGVGEHLKDTIPYFLGAVPPDAAAKKAALRDAQRTLRRSESALTNALREASEMDTTLRGLLAEAHAAGLTDVHDLTDRESVVTALRATRPRLLRQFETGEEPRGGVLAGDQASLGDDDADSVPSSPLSDVEAQDRRRELASLRNRLQDELSRVMENRALLLEHADGESAFAAAVALHTGRLTSLDLLPPVENNSRPAVNVAATADEGAHSAVANGENTEGSQPIDERETGEQSNASDYEQTCPLCGNHLAQPDPSATAVANRLSDLREQLAELTAAPASRRKARMDLEARAAALRLELSAAESALDALASAGRVAAAASGQPDQDGDSSINAAQNFTRGRIDALLGSLATAGGDAVRQARAAVEAAARRIALLETELNTDDEREQLQSRLNVIGRSMTRYADEFGLEHGADSVRLDLSQLTVVTDTDQGPIPLYRIGSAANWVGYHLATHLALHKYFTENERPVPRFLMLDQPTQAYYPSEARKRTGQPENDADRAAVLAMFTVMRDVVTELAPRMQIIVCDHAYLEEDWFRAAVAHNWRDGRKLIPLEWLSDDPTQT